MKSGLAALAIALIEINNSNALKNGRIRFLATTGEEMEQLGSQQSASPDFISAAPRPYKKPSSSVNLNGSYFHC